MQRYDSVTVAQLLRAEAYKVNLNLNITQVQKLLYILYGYYLSKDIVIIDEQPKAWPYGPVFPRTRNKVDFNSVIFPDDPSLSEVIKNSDLVTNVDKIIEKFGRVSASKLSDWSHKKDSPWSKTVEQNGSNWNTVIDDEDIKEYFSTINIID